MMNRRVTVLTLLIAVALPALAGSAAAPAIPLDGQRDLHQAELYFRAGQFKEAVAKARAAIEKAPTCVAAHHVYQDAREALGELQQTIEEYRQRARQSPQHALAQYLLGRIVGDLAEKEQLFTRAVALDPGLAWAHYGLGHLREYEKKYPEAEQSLRQAIALQPDFAPFHHALGYCFVQQGKDAEAEGEFKAALKCDPRYADSLLNLSLVAMRRKDYDAAIAWCEKALEVDKANPWAHNNLGKAYYGQGRYAGALKHFQAALADPRYDSPELAYLNMGFVYRAQSKPEQAAAAFRKAIELMPGFAYAHNCLAYALYDEKKYDEAWEQMKKAQELGYTVPERFLKALEAARGKKGE